MPTAPVTGIHSEEKLPSLQVPLRTALASARKQIFLIAWSATNRVPGHAWFVDPEILLSNSSSWRNMVRNTTNIIHTRKGWQPMCQSRSWTIFIRRPSWLSSREVEGEKEKRNHATVGVWSADSDNEVYGIERLYIRGARYPKWGQPVLEPGSTMLPAFKNKNN